jgi:hypothetical protein
MAIKITVSDTVGFKVKGAINDAAGVAHPFDFSLTCTRLDADQIKTKLKSDSEASIDDFMVDVVVGWSGVKDADDKQLAYSEESLRQLFKIAGVAGVSFSTYMSEVGAKAKN